MLSKKNLIRRQIWSVFQNGSSNPVRDSSLKIVFLYLRKTIPALLNYIQQNLSVQMNNICLLNGLSLLGIHFTSDTILVDLPQTQVI